MEKIEQLKTDLEEAKKALAEAKTDKEKNDANELIASISTQIEEIEEAEESGNASDEESQQNKKKHSKKTVDIAKFQLQVMNRYGVNKLFVNKKGEYFTNPNLAENSVKDKKELKTVTREHVESIIQ